MPFQNDISEVTSDLQLAPADDPTTALEQLGAAFERENVGVNIFRSFREPRAPSIRDDNFDPYEHLEPGEELIASRFATANSVSEMSRIRQDIAREKEVARVLGSGPMPEIIASVPAVLLDLDNLLPIGAATKGAKGAKLALGMGAVAAGSNLAAEAALQATQRTRSMSETAAAIIVGGAFGFGLGGVAGKLASRTARAADNAATDIAAIARAGEPEPDFARFGDPGPGGAAAAARMPAEDTELVGSKGVAEALSKLGKWGLAAPGLELSASGIRSSREAIHSLVDTGLMVKGNLKGSSLGSDVFTRIKRYDAVIVEGQKALERLYKEHKIAGGAMTRPQFLDEVGKSMRRGDTHVDPAVQTTARLMREKIFDPLAKEAQKFGLLPDDVKPETALSYFTRVYDRRAIRQNRNALKGRIVRWLEREQGDTGDAIEPGELEIVADQLIDAILGHPIDRIPFIKVPVARGPLKERTFLIPDEEIEDFLVSDVGEVMSRYARTMSADIEMTRRFGRPDPGEDLAKRIMDDANKQADDMPDGPAKEKFLKQAEREAGVVQTLVERVRGVDTRPADPSYMGLRRMGKVARDLNFVRLLGKVTLSSIPDLGRVFTQEGTARTMGVLLRGFGNGFKEVRMGIKEARMAGTALDMWRSQTLSAVLDVGARYGETSRAEKVLDQGTQHFANFTGINRWNTALKGITSTLATSRLLSTTEKLLKGQKLTSREIRKLARSGIDETMARRIADQAEHWEREADGIIFANTEAWTDGAAREAFRDAILRDVDNTIITPTAGDAPLWTSSEWGKTVFQFKRFSGAAVQRITVSALQERDMVTLNGLMAMIGLGALSTALRDIATDGSVRERTGRQWAVDAVDRSGVLAMFMEGDALMDKFTGIGIARSISGEQASRFAARGAIGQALGPTFGLAEDIQKALLTATDDTFTQSDTKTLRRLVPAQNLIGVSALFDGMERGVNSALGIPERAPR